MLISCSKSTNKNISNKIYIFYYNQFCSHEKAKMMEKTLNKTAVFWDYENMTFSAGDLTNFLNDIEEFKKNFSESSFLRCFGDWKRVPEAIQTEIRQAGFELIQVPQTRKNAIDQAITIFAINVYHQSYYTNFV